jgi:hypothetical protein
MTQRKRNKTQSVPIPLLTYAMNTELGEFTTTTLTRNNSGPTITRLYRIPSSSPGQQETGTQNVQNPGTTSEVTDINSSNNNNNNNNDNDNDNNNIDNNDSAC